MVRTDSGRLAADTGNQVRQYHQVSIVRAEYAVQSSVGRRSRLETFPGIDSAENLLRPATRAPVTPLTGAFVHGAPDWETGRPMMRRIC